MISATSAFLAVVPHLLMVSATADQSAFCPQKYENANAPAHIAKSSVTMVVPDAPGQLQGGAGPFYVWPGVYNQADGLDQPILQYGGQTCPDAWCVFAGSCNGCGNGGPFQTTPNPPVPVSTGDELVFQINTDASGTHQIITRGADTLVTMDTSGIDTYAWQLRPEIYLNDVFTPPQVSWTNVQIVFDAPNPTADQFLYTAALQAGTFTTTDGGVTWTIDRVDFNQDQCDPNATSG